MTTVRVEAQGEANDTYIVVEQIVRADFFTSGVARNQAHAMVYTPDGNGYRVDSPHVHALEQRFQGSQLVERP